MSYSDEIPTKNFGHLINLAKGIIAQPSATERLLAFRRASDREGNFSAEIEVFSKLIPAKTTEEQRKILEQVYSQSNGSEAVNLVYQTYYSALAAYLAEAGLRDKKDSLAR